MPFFENARQFEVNGGNFIDLKGNQNNYHYDQSLKVSGQGNSAVYSRGPYYNGADNRIYNSTSGQMMVIGQGVNAQVALNPNAMPNYLANQMNNFGQSPGQSYSPPPAAQPYSHFPPPNTPPSTHSNGMFHHSTGHVNQPYYTPQQQPSPAANHFPPSPQPVGPHLSPPGHHSQVSVNSAPANVQQVQINQSLTQPPASQSNGLVSSNTVSQQTVSPPDVNQMRPSINPLPGINATESSQAGSMMSGATLTNGPQPTHATSPSTVSATTTTTATTPSSSSSSSASSPVVTHAQPTSNSTPPSGLSEYPNLIPKPGVTVPTSVITSPVEEDGKKKKKKRKFFSRLFGKKA